MSNWREGVRGLEPFPEQPMASARNLKERERNVYPTWASVIGWLLHTPHSCSRTWMHCLSHHWPTSPAVSGLQRLPGPLGRLDRHWVLVGSVNCCESSLHRGQGCQSPLPPKPTRGCSNTRIGFSGARLKSLELLDILVPFDLSDKVSYVPIPEWT